MTLHHHLIQNEMCVRIHYSKMTLTIDAEIDSFGTMTYIYRHDLNVWEQNSLEAILIYTHESQRESFFLLSSYSLYALLY